jgi:hypothetical protein
VPTACRSVRVLNASGKQKILDKPYTHMILCPMLNERITSPSTRPPGLTPFPTHSSGLFVAAKNVNSFGINQIHTLSAKHPGWGSTGGHLGGIRCPRPTTHYPLASPLFSWSYELLFPQVLSFHKDPNCPGGCEGQAGWYQPLGKGGSDGKADDLHSLYADFALLLRADLANPYHLAPEGAQRVLIQDQFKGLPWPKPAIHAESETNPCRVDYETRHPSLVSMEIEDQAGALLRDNPFVSAAFGNRRGGHRAALSV